MSIRRAPLRHGWRSLPALLAMVLIGACEIGKTVIPRGEPMLVVHAILNPSTTNQSVIVERSLTGAISVDTTRFNPQDPVSSTGGIPVSGAQVTLTSPSGVELGLGLPGEEISPGIYSLPVLVMHSGWTYVLTVVAGGDTVTGSTTVPNVAVYRGGRFASFNRDHDSVTMQFPQSPSARAFWVRIETPFDPFDLFSLDRGIAISGQIRNPFASDLQHVFYPGFDQLVTIAAIDTNVYDYYRSGNDPFSGTGLINHLRGGVGVFGSIAVIDRRNLRVTQDPTGDPIEGRYTLRSQDKSFPSEMTLYLAARGAGTADQISGWFLATARGSILGTRTNGDLRLHVGNTGLWFHGALRGDTLAGSYIDPVSGISLSPDFAYVRFGK